MDRIIKKVIKNNANDQKLITIPKKSPFEVGDYVELILVPKPEQNEKGEYVWKKIQR